MTALVDVNRHGYPSFAHPNPSFLTPDGGPRLPAYTSLEPTLIPLCCFLLEFVVNTTLGQQFVSDKAYKSQSPLFSVLFYSAPHPYTPQARTHMPRERRSLSTLLIPSFLQQASSPKSVPSNDSAISRSQDPATHPCPPPSVDPFSQALSSFIPSDGLVQSDLLDDDPFAKFSTRDIHPPSRAPNVPSDAFPSSNHPLLYTPDRLSHPTFDHPSFHSPPDSSPNVVSDTQSILTPPSPSPPDLLSLMSPPPLALPAYTEPIFKPTQSLPSLRMLARGEFTQSEGEEVLEGRVSATLPLVPSISPGTESDPISTFSHSSYFSDAVDIPIGSIFKRNFDHHSTKDYGQSFNLSSAEPSDVDDPSSRLSFSPVPSDLLLSRSLDTLSTSDVSYTSSVTAYSTDSDHQTYFSPSSSINSPSASVQINYRRVSNRIDFDIEPLRLSRCSSPCASCLGSTSRSVSPSSSDPEDDRFFSVVDSYPSAEQTEFQPGTSVETIRPCFSRPLLGAEELSEFIHCDPTSDQRRSVVLSPDVINTRHNSLYSALSDNAMEVSSVENTGESSGNRISDWTTEAVEGGDQTHGNQGRSSTDDDDRHEDVGDRECADGQARGNIGGGSGSGSGGDDDDPRRNGKELHGFSITSLFLDPEEEEVDEEDYHTTEDYDHSQPVPSNSGAADVSTSDSDDVPLARSIPTALKAQRTIRKEVRIENAQRKREKALRSRHPRKSRPSELLNVDSSRSPSHAESHQSQTLRLPTLTSPSDSSPSAVNVDHLTKKLMVLRSAPAASTVHSRKNFSSDDLTCQTQNGESSLRSFRRLRTRASTPSTPALIPQHQASNSSTPGPASADDRRLNRSKTRSGYSTADELGRHRRPSEDQNTIFRTEDSRSMPPLPPYELVAKLKSEPMWQQRFFIGDLQRFSLVEIGASTSAQNVIDTLQNQGELQGNGWMLFELAQDFGMERPIRSFETLSNVTSSWNTEKTVNYFLLKRTQLAALLAVSALPTSAPTFRGYIEYEVKRGKWSKRWMELREHGLWLSKRDSMKDESFLCRLSNFDVYSITRPQKSPKPFMFAIKSTDNLSYFEDTADYLHRFSCNEKDGLQWMANILLARSYLLYRERLVFSSKSPTEPQSGTRRAGRPRQALVTVDSSISPVPTMVSFEPGSLLAQRGRT